MKKILLFCLFFGLSFGAFSKPIIQMDYDGIGLFSQYDNNIFDTANPPVSSMFFSPMSGLNTAFLWEFNNKQSENFHLYTGLELGLAGMGIPLSVVFGGNLKLADLGNMNLEMNSSIQSGVILDIIMGYLYYYSKANVDFVVMSNKRKGFYGGIGLSDYIIPDLNYYVGYGLDTFFVNYFGLRFVAGYRF